MVDKGGAGVRAGRRSFFLALLALLTIAAVRPCSHAQARPAWAGRIERMRLTRSGQAFDVLASRSARPGPRPAILVLGGSKGYVSESYGSLLSALNGAGFDAFLIEYLSADDEAAMREAGSAAGRVAFYAGRLAGWSDTVRITVEHLRAETAPPTGFGVIGISLGAMPALSASANGSGVGALAIVDGSLPDEALTRINALPPLLTVWGTADRVFPVGVGAKLDGLARRLGGTPQAATYEGRSHAFFVDPDDIDAARARTAVVAFLSRHL